MSQRPASVVAGAPPPPWVDASSREELRREARVVGLKGIDVPSLEAVERRRVQLWTLSTILLVVLSAAVVVSMWWRPEAAGIRASQLVLRMSVLALTVSFAVYCFEKEAQLRRLSHLLLDERMLTVALANRLRELSLLLEAGKAMNSVLELPQVLGAILRSALELLHGANGSIMLLDDGGSELLTVCSFGNDAARDARQRVGEGIAGTVAHDGEPLLINGRAQEGDFPGLARRATTVESAMSVPLVHHDEVIGVLNVNAEAERAFTEYDLRALSLFAEQAASTIAKARLIETHRAQAEQLAHLAFHDGLTGVANRALLLDRARQALARRRPGAVALLFIDLDGFKAVNDRFGHSAGDRLLADVARRLRGVVRPSDTVARVGGDEFVVLCEDLADEGEAVGVATRIEQAVAEPFRLGGGEAKVGASVGIALATEGEGDPETLLRDADTAMYRAKQLGKAGHQVFNATMRRAATARLRTESLLRHALDQSRLRLAYHPVVDLADGSVVAGDAVVRLAGGAGGIVLPDEFVDVAEESGLVVPLGRWALVEACVQAAAAEAGPRGERLLGIHVGVSPVQLGAGDFAATVSGALTESGLDARRLFLTLADRSLAELSPSAVATLRRVAEQGAHVGIDGLGAGPTSLPRLGSLPVDFVKIDPSLTRGVGGDDEATRVVGSLVSAVAALGLTVVGAGVGTTQEAEALRRLGCHLAQGPCFGRPLRELSPSPGRP